MPLSKFILIPGGDCASGVPLSITIIPSKSQQTIFSCNIHTTLCKQISKENQLNRLIIDQLAKGYTMKEIHANLVSRATHLYGMIESHFAYLYCDNLVQ